MKRARKPNKHQNTPHLSNTPSNPWQQKPSRKSKEPSDIHHDLETQQLIATDDIANLLLDFLKLHRATCLALEVIDGGSERLELGSTRSLGTAVERILIWYHSQVIECIVSHSSLLRFPCLWINTPSRLTGWGIEMLVQPIEQGKYTVATVAYVPGATPRFLGRNEYIIIGRRRDTVLTDDIVAVTGANQPRKLPAAAMGGTRAASSLDVVCHSCRRGEGVGTERAFDGSTKMYARVQML